MLTNAQRRLETVPQHRKQADTYNRGGTPVPGGLRPEAGVGWGRRRQAARHRDSPPHTHCPIQSSSITKACLRRPEFIDEKTEA